MRRLLASLAVVLGLSTGVARADTFYAVTFGDQLITIDSNTGVGTLVGPLSTPMAAFGLGFRGSNLYTFDQTADLIRQLNPATGATVASINVGITTVGEGGIDFRSDGIGFMTTGGSGTFWRFDITTGTSTQIATGITPNGVDGLAFDASDTLYALNQGGNALYTVNQTTGATTLVGNTGLSGFILGGLTFDSQGNLFAVLSGTGSPSFLYRINTTTGAATLVGNVGFNGVSGLTGQVGQVAAVPEPASLAALGAGLLGLAAARRARRKAA